MKQILLFLLFLLIAAPLFAQVVDQGQPANTTNVASWPFKIVFGDAQIDPRVRTPISRTATATFDTLDEELVIEANGVQTILAVIESTNLNGTITASASFDGGSTYLGAHFYDSTPALNLKFAASATFDGSAQNRYFFIGRPFLAATHIKLRLSVATSGSAAVTLRAVDTPNDLLWLALAGNSASNAWNGGFLIGGGIQDASNQLPFNVTAAGSVSQFGNMLNVGVGFIAAGTNAIGKLAANSGVDIGDVTINNAAGAAAVNIQDGGNSITIDGTVAATATDFDIRDLVFATDKVDVTGSTVTVTDGAGSLNVIVDSGTVTANQGTPNSTANRWPVQLTDGTDLSLVSAAGALLVDNSAVTQPVSGTVAISATVVPAGLGSILTGQQAVTASAVALPSNAGRLVCVKVLEAGTQNVFYGPSGVTTATGMQLLPGEGACRSLDNSNRVFVIAAGSGSTVAFEVY